MNSTFSQFIDARRFEQDYSLSRRTFFKLIADGKLEAYKFSKRKTLVKRADVEALLAASKTACDVDRLVDDTLRDLANKK
ncbi:MAG: hypothetical protein AB1671_13110 [Thermodesulfobacteriota bacterium]|jgi:excisionase family DNA binding protein